MRARRSRRSPRTPTKSTSSRRSKLSARRSLKSVPNEAEECEHPTHDEMRDVMGVFGARFGHEIDGAEAIKRAQHEEYQRKQQSERFHDKRPRLLRMKQHTPTIRQYQPNGRRSFDLK